MDLLTRRVNRNQLDPGDHIYTWRAGCTYSHHGIYVGRNKVIHFTGPEIASSSSGWSLFSSSSSSSGPKMGQYCDCGLNRKSGGGVYVICLDCFLESGSLYLYKYDMSRFAFYFTLATVQAGIMTIAPSDSSEVVIARANYLLQHGFGSYHFIKNNCEDFALYCKTGLLVCAGGSGQVLHQLLQDIGLRGVGLKVKMEDVRIYKK